MENIKKNLEEKDILHDILVLEKDIVKTYGMSIVECSCPVMRDLFNKHMDQASADQFAVYTNMNKRGYYPTEPAPAQKLQETKDQFKQIQKSLS